MFLAKTGTVYRSTKSANRVVTFNLFGTIKCKLVFGSGNDPGFEGAPDYDTYRMYTRTMDLKIGDKVVIDDTNYVIESPALYKGVMKQYAKYFVKKSQGE